MQYPDETIDISQLTMKEFVGHSRHLFTQMQDDQTEVDFIRFVLAARVGPLADEELDQYQVRLNCLQGIPTPPEIDITRDLDSVIGVSDTLPYTSTLSIWPLPPFRETLKKDNHVKSRAYNSQGAEIEVPMHKIPNMPLGKVQQRHVVRIFFPRLYSTEWPVDQLTQDKLALIYDQCLRPTMLEVVPESRDKWPTTYAAAYAQSRSRTGSLAFSSTDIPWYRLEQVATTLLAKLADLGPGFRDAYFGHELRGTKGATIHNGRDEDERRLAMDDLFEHVDVDSLDPEQWHVDVALTIGVPGHLARPELLQTADLPFTKAQYCVCTDDQWTMHFDRLFPETIENAKRQNFGRCTYYTKYVAFARVITKKSLSRARRVLKAEFDKLAWVPYTRTDRLWSSGKMQGAAWEMLPRGANRGGPAIAINPLRRRELVTLRVFDQPGNGDSESEGEE
ncbi:uncharacterized protein HD556DRAFT_1238042 [Suillus plorans]|uniref:Uncharacterized protein n=1 Tax=Suillus plorans TaxID=116603 RepID=A0A9P7ANU8_9AGAM|nr:uncharacterized protein HD556DRAFT_1238042 [Suillus plorans]KAG1793321.1 hypothetical protein HD556DRAFT_1238042 [Suillus plorans]